MNDKENASSDFANTVGNKKEGTLSVSYCFLANRFVLKMWKCDEWLCLHQDTIVEERKEIKQFIKQNATTIVLLKSNGRQERCSIDDFCISFKHGYLEHNSKRIAINLFKSIEHSYEYQYDGKDEIVDKEPFNDIIIL